MQNNTMIDVALLRKALEHVTTYSEEWDQRFWGTRTTAECGTKYCLAGHVVSMSGAELHWDEGLTGQTHLVAANGDDVGDSAQEALGLDSTQAALLFEPSNTLPRLWMLASEFTGGVIEVPDGMEPS